MNAGLAGPLFISSAIIAAVDGAGLFRFHFRWKTPASREALADRGLAELAPDCAPSRAPGAPRLGGRRCDLRRVVVSKDLNRLASRRSTPPHSNGLAFDPLDLIEQPVSLAFTPTWWIMARAP